MNNDLFVVLMQQTWAHHSKHIPFRNGSRSVARHIARQDGNDDAKMEWFRHRIPLFERYKRQKRTKKLY